MVEQINSTKELMEKYEVVTGTRPKKGDLVYVMSQKAVFEVEHADRMNVRVERGAGKLLTLPASHYKLVKKK